MEVCVYHALDSINEINRKMPEVTLRDLFAMSALNGMLSNTDSFGLYEQQSDIAYMYADAMLKARKQK